MSALEKTEVPLPGPQNSTPPSRQRYAAAPPPPPPSYQQPKESGFFSKHWIIGTILIILIIVVLFNVLYSASGCRQKAEDDPDNLSGFCSFMKNTHDVISKLGNAFMAPINWMMSVLGIIVAGMGLWWAFRGLFALNKKFQEKMDAADAIDRAEKEGRELKADEVDGAVYEKDPSTGEYKLLETRAGDGVLLNESQLKELEARYPSDPQVQQALQEIMKKRASEGTLEDSVIDPEKVSDTMEGEGIPISE